MESGNFRCSVCEKVCKTKGGLTRHRNSKHKVGSDSNHPGEGNGNDKEISNELLIALVNQSCKDLSGDLCFPLDICSRLASFEMQMPEEEDNISEEKAEFSRMQNRCTKCSVVKGTWKNSSVNFMQALFPKQAIFFTHLVGVLNTPVVVYYQDPPIGNFCDSILAAIVLH